MFKPTAKFKKILKDADCAWLYQDGIVIQQKKTAKIGRAKIPVQVYHVIPCEIRISRNKLRTDLSYVPPEEMQKYVGSFRRLVFHNPTLLLDGVEHIHIHYDNLSDAMKKQDIHCTTVIIRTVSGMEIYVNRFSFLSGEITVQPDIPTVDPFSTNCNVPDTIEGCKTSYDRDEIVYVYDEKGKIVE